MKKIQAASLLGGVLLGAVAADASAAPPAAVQATEVQSAQAFPAISKLTMAEILRTYGAPKSVKQLAGGTQEMAWSLAGGQFQVITDVKSGKVRGVKVVPEATQLALCVACGQGNF